MYTFIILLSGRVSTPIRDIVIHNACGISFSYKITRLIKGQSKSPKVSRETAENSKFPIQNGEF